MLFWLVRVLFAFVAQSVSLLFSGVRRDQFWMEELAATDINYDTPCPDGCIRDLHLLPFDEAYALLMKDIDQSALPSPSRFNNRHQDASLTTKNATLPGHPSPSNAVGTAPTMDIALLSPAKLSHPRIGVALAYYTERRCQPS